MRAANYLEMTTTSIASSGAGAVTCTQITNMPTFTIVFGSGACSVQYTIEDTVNKKFESGIGSVASNVLTRTRPQITWDGTTWDDSTPSALTFTGSPASGDILIRLSAVAQNTVGPMPQPQTLISGDTWRDYPFSAHWAGSYTNGTGVTLVTAREYYTPYKLERAGILSGLQYEITTGVSGSMKSALYSSGYNGLPAEKIVDFVTTSVTSTAVKTDTATGSWTPSTPPFLTPGWYWIGQITNAACSMRGQGATSTISTPNPLGRKDGYGYGGHVYVGGNYTTGLPATPSLSGGTVVGGSTAGALWWIGLKVTA